ARPGRARRSSWAAAFRPGCAWAAGGSRARVGRGRVRRARRVRPHAGSVRASVEESPRLMGGAGDHPREGRFAFFVSSAYATISAGSAVLLLGLLMLAGRLLSADDYGRFSFALALATIIETVMDIGLGQVTVRSVARDRDDAGRIFRDVLGLKLVWVA